MRERQKGYVRKCCTVQYNKLKKEGEELKEKPKPIGEAKSVREKPSGRYVSVLSVFVNSFLLLSVSGWLAVYLSV